MGAHEKLEPGLFRYEQCENCVQTAPPIRHYIDDEDRLEAIDNHWACKGSVTQFSVGLMGYHKVLKKLSDIERACSFHAHLHIHRWSFLYPKRRLKVQSVSKLNDAEQVQRAYDQSISYILIGALERREAWYRRKP